jgi:23S rRNA (pseudouridine1915-N3)-methyltransferase
MRVTICAVGRLRSGPERELVADYLARFDRTGRALGLGPAEVVEIEDRSGGGRGGEAAALARVLPAGAAIWALDERGEMLPSPGFAAALARLRDEARPLALLIGGADGLDPGLRDRADRLLSFGPMVWPHMLVRVMLAEQLYRSATILAGTPYHRA